MIEVVPQDIVLEVSGLHGPVLNLKSLLLKRCELGRLNMPVFDELRHFRFLLREHLTGYHHKRDASIAWLQLPLSYLNVNLHFLNLASELLLFSVGIAGGEGTTRGQESESAPRLSPPSFLLERAKLVLRLSTGSLTAEVVDQLETNLVALVHISHDLLKQFSLRWQFALFVFPQQLFDFYYARKSFTKTFPSTAQQV